MENGRWRSKNSEVGRKNLVRQKEKIISKAALMVRRDVK